MRDMTLLKKYNILWVKKYTKKKIRGYDGQHHTKKDILSKMDKFFEKIIYRISEVSTKELHNLKKIYPPAALSVHGLM